MVNTLLSATQYLQSGLPVSDDIREAEVNTAIIAVEQMYVKERLKEYYVELLEYVEQTTHDDDEFNALLDGGALDDIYIAGIREAELHLVYAWMIMDRLRLTRFDTVEKTDEYSSHPSSEQVDSISRHHWELGQKMLRDVEEYLGIEGLNNTTDGFFNTLYY